MNEKQARSKLTALGTRRATVETARAAIVAEMKDLIPAALEAGVTVTEIAQLTGLSRVGVYDVIKRAR